jgi:hypothetical protein
MNNKHPTATDELFRNFVAAASVLALVAAASFIIRACGNECLQAG